MVAGLGVLAALAGCGVQPSGVITGAAPPSGRAEPSATLLYLVSGDRLQPVWRLGGRLPDAAALNLLAAGPTDAEAAEGVTTEVPAEATPFSTDTGVSGVVHVSTALPADQVAELPDLAIAQILCTVAARAELHPLQVRVIGVDPDFEAPDCPPAPPVPTETVPPQPRPPTEATPTR
ncbi:MAG TPA: hypothetical protein VIL37_08875 [Natronosporangium sp.]